MAQDTRKRKSTAGRGKSVGKEEKGVKGSRFSVLAEEGDQNVPNEANLSHRGALRNITNESEVNKNKRVGSRQAGRGAQKKTEKGQGSKVGQKKGKTSEGITGYNVKVSEKESEKREVGEKVKGQEREHHDRTPGPLPVHSSEPSGQNPIAQIGLPELSKAQQPKATEGASPTGSDHDMVVDLNSDGPNPLSSPLLAQVQFGAQKEQSRLILLKPITLGGYPQRQRFTTGRRA